MNPVTPNAHLAYLPIGHLIQANLSGMTSSEGADDHDRARKEFLDAPTTVVVSDEQQATAGYRQRTLVNVAQAAKTLLGYTYGRGFAGGHRCAEARMLVAMPGARKVADVAMIQGVPLADASEEGSAYYALALASGLQRSGLLIEIWAKRIPARFVSQIVPISRVWRPGFVAWLDLITAIRARRPHIVHLQHSMFSLGPKASGEFSTLLFLIGTWLLRVKLVITCHDVPSIARITPEYIRLNRYRFPVSVVRLGLRTVFRFMGISAKRLIVHHASLRDILIKDYGIPAFKVATIPLSSIASERRTRDDARRRLHISSSANVVLYFGFATGYKGIEALLDAMEALGNELHGTIQLILGAGHHPKKHDNADYDRYYQWIATRATQLCNVRFVGFISDETLDDYIAASDACVFPYVEFQGMSGPLLQAADHGIPLLVSTVIAAALAHLNAGSFEPTREGIALALKRFFNDAKFRSVVAAESGEFGAARSSDDSAARTRRLYEALGAAPQ